MHILACLHEIGHASAAIAEIPGAGTVFRHLRRVCDTMVGIRVFAENLVGLGFL